MEKRIIVILLVFAFCVPTFGLSPMGPPKAGLDQGQYRIGLEYSYSEMDLEFSASGSATGEVETNMLFANLGYGITEQLEGFVRLGVAAIEIEVADFDSGGELAYGFGTKFTFAEKENISWGGIFQIGIFEGDDNISGVDVEIDAFEIQIAVGPTYETENIRIYGGPFLHFVDGDGDVEIFGFSESFDIEQESVFGGYVGAQFDVAENTAASVELQFTADAWCIAAGVGFGF